MSANFSIDIKFNESYFEKLGLKNHNGFDDCIEKAVDHATHDAENICRREAPIDTGNLRRSIHKRRPGKGKGQLTARDAPYWVYLQYGTSKMSTNPFVTRTARRVKPKLQHYVLEELKRANILD